MDGVVDTTGSGEYVPMTTWTVEGSETVPQEGVTEEIPKEEAPQEEEEKVTPEAEVPPEDEDERLAKSKRYQDLVHRRKEAELEAQRERAERERLEERLRALETPPEKPKAVPPGVPTLNDFETVDEWQVAFTEWQTQNILSTLEAQQAEKAAKEAARTAQQKAQEAVSKYEREEVAYKARIGPEAAKAFDEATNRLRPFVAGSPTLFRALIQSSPEVVQEVAGNLELAQRLSEADPITVGMEIGRIAAGVSDKGRQGRKYSGAPPPEPTVGGMKAGALPRDYEKLTGDEYARVRDQEEAERRKTQYGGGGRRW